MNFRHFGKLTAGVTLLFTLFGLPAKAQVSAYPSKPIHMIVPSAAGGGVDILARMVAEGLSSALGQPVVVENRAGAGGVIAANAVLNAPADGHTLFTIMSSVLTVAPTLFDKSAKYDPLKDFVPISPIAEVPLALVVNGSLPVKSMTELIQLAKTKPGGLNYASSANGAMSHLSVELFKQQTGIDVVRVPYQGGAPAMTALVGGQVQMMINNMVEVGPFMDGSRVRALAVATKERLPGYPNVPTIAESGLPGYDVKLWYGVIAKAGTPKEIVDRLNNAIQAILAKPDVRAKLANMSSIPMRQSSSEFGGLIQEEFIKWKKVIRDGEIKAE